MNPKKWLGYKDSNLGVSVSETDALPLGDIPISFLILYTILL